MSLEKWNQDSKKLTALVLQWQTDRDPETYNRATTTLWQMLERSIKTYIRKSPGINRPLEKSLTGNIDDMVMNLLVECIKPQASSGNSSLEKFMASFDPSKSEDFYPFYHSQIIAKRIITVVKGGVDGIIKEPVFSAADNDPNSGIEAIPDTRPMPPDDFRITRMDIVRQLYLDALRDLDDRQCQYYLTWMLFSNDQKFCAALFGTTTTNFGAIICRAREKITAAFARLSEERYSGIDVIDIVASKNEVCALANTINIARILPEPSGDALRAELHRHILYQGLHDTRIVGHIATREGRDPAEILELFDETRDAIVGALVPAFASARPDHFRKKTSAGELFTLVENAVWPSGIAQLAGRAREVFGQDPAERTRFCAAHDLTTSELLDLLDTLAADHPLVAELETIAERAACTVDNR